MRPQARLAAATATVLLTGASLLVACSGGSEPIDLDGLGPTPGEPNLPGPPGGDGNPYEIGGTPGTGQSGATTATTTTSATTTTTGSAGGSQTTCFACNDFLQGATYDGSQTFCTGSEDPFFALVNCACPNCPEDCASTCNSGVIDATCANCASAMCPTELSDCANN